MAVPNVDAVFSFQHLVDNLPQWKTTVTELSTYSSQKHTEFVAEYSRLLHQARPKKPKSPSMCSVRSSDERSACLPDGPHERSATPGASDYVEISPLEAGNRFLYAQAHRKRKPGTSMRSGASGPTRFRNKQMAVIYYDAHIQSELDKLVKGIGAARNYLRKGKNAYSASRGFQLPSISRRFEHLLPGRDIYKSNRLAPRLPQTKSDTTVETTMNPPTGEAAFTRTDKELEAIQSICETAAHQAIRDGDCKLELDNTLKNMDSLLVLAKTSLDEFIAEEEKRKKEEEEARLKEEAEAAATNEVSSNSTPSTLCDDDESIEAFNITNKGLPSFTEALDGLKRPPIHSISSAPASAPMLDAIEVDDDDEDDQSSIDLDISKFRMTNTRRVRA